MIGAGLLAAAVIIAAALAFALPGRARAAPTVIVYGAAGSFGQLAGASTLPTGQGVATRAVPGWGFLPGEAAYFTVVGPDGTVLTANEPQTDNQLEPTAQNMVISAFNPASQRFHNIVIPTTTGATDVVGLGPNRRGEVGGADVSDLAVIPAGDSVDRTARIAFISAVPYGGWSISKDGVFPSLGYLTHRASGWSYDQAASRTALQIARSAGARSAQACATQTSLDSRPLGNCRGLTETAVLPRSHDLAITQYFSSSSARTSGSLVVLGQNGEVLATYPYPDITLPGGAVVHVDPREIDADPDSPTDGEHFVVIFDSTTTHGSSSQSGPFAMQEFSFDAATDIITPLSPPILSGDIAPDGTRLGFETARYDSSGDLWVGQSETGTLTGGPIAIYRRQAGGSTVARRGCSVTPSWYGSGWGTVCRPDTEIHHSATLGIVRSLNLATNTGAMLITTASGDLLPVLTADRDTKLTALAPINLGLDELANRSVVTLDFRKGSIDAATNTLYLPAQQLQTARECSNYPCAPRVLDQWLYAIKLDSIVGR